MMAKTALLGATALWALLGMAAHAQEAELYPLGSTTVDVTENNDFEKELRYEGKVLLADSMVVLDAQIVASGVALRTGTSSAGGNACAGQRFVIWQQGAEVKLAQVDDPCYIADPVVSDGVLRLVGEPLPGAPGRIWAFDPAKGLVEEAPVAFGAATGTGWEDVAKLDEHAHPIDALKIAPVYHQLQNALTPEHFARFSEILSELGSGGPVPEGYAGHACVKLDCETVHADLIIDTAAQQVFAAWSDGDNQFAFPGNFDSWPDWARAQLND